MNGATPAGLRAEVRHLEALATRIHTAQQELRRRRAAAVQVTAGQPARPGIGTPAAAASSYRPVDGRVECITRSPGEPAGPGYRAVCTGVAVRTVDSVRCPPGCGGHPICQPCLDLAIHRGLVTTPTSRPQPHPTGGSGALTGQGAAP